AANSFLHHIWPLGRGDNHTYPGVCGDFVEGNAVTIVNTQGQEFGKGIVNYPSEEIELIKGAQSKDIKRILGHKDYDEVIHRDNLVLC
ncbi:MAG TPA: PUA domain-containing protein, partial [Bacillota bacterium]|nr:PUA domain-containing protein [Bacillota bacterium]